MTYFNVDIRAARPHSCRGSLFQKEIKGLWSHVLKESSVGLVNSSCRETRLENPHSLNADMKMRTTTAYSSQVSVQLWSCLCWWSQIIEGINGKKRNIICFAVCIKGNSKIKGLLLY